MKKEFFVCKMTERSEIKSEIPQNSFAMVEFSEEESDCDVCNVEFKFDQSMISEEFVWHPKKKF